MIQLHRGYVPQRTFSLFPLTLYFLPENVLLVCSAGHAVTVTAEPLVEKNSKVPSNLSFHSHVHMKMLNT